jgi:hypothetical protein
MVNCSVSAGLKIGGGMSRSQRQITIWILTLGRDLAKNYGVSLFFTALASTFFFVGGLLNFATKHAWLAAIFVLFLFFTLDVTVAAIARHVGGGQPPSPPVSTRTLTAWATILAACGLVVLAIVTIVGSNALDGINPWLIVMVFGVIGLVAAFLVGMASNAAWVVDAQLAVGGLSSIVAVVGFVGFLVDIGAFTWLTNPWWWVFLVLVIGLVAGLGLMAADDEPSLLLASSGVLAVFGLTFLAAHGEWAWLFFALLVVFFIGSLIAVDDLEGAIIGVVLAPVGLLLMMILYLAGAL